MARAKKTTTAATVDNKQVTAEIENMSVFSQNDKETFARCVSNIEVAQRQAEGLAETIAGNLYIINKKELYKLEDYDNIHKFAMDKFEISKGTVSDSINTFERFGDGTTGLLKPKYLGYKFSTLMKLKKFSDKEIEEMGITPEMSRSLVLKAIDQYKENKALMDSAPQLRKDWAETYAELSKVMPRPEDRVEHLKDILGDAHGKAIEEMTPVELQRAIELTTALIDSIKGDDTEQEQDTESSAVEQSSDNELEIEDITEGYEESEEEEEEEELHSYPEKEIHISGITNAETGKVDMKLLTAAIETMIQEVVDHNADIRITW